MLKLGDVAVVVSDAQAAARWWEEKLGFEVRSREGHWVTVGPKGQDGLVLHLCQTGEKEQGNTGIGFEAENLEREVAELQKRGVRITTPVTKESWGTYAMFADPDGNEFWIS